MASATRVEATAQSLIHAVLRTLRPHENGVRLHPTEWMELLQVGGDSVLGLAGVSDLEVALKDAFPDRFAGALGSFDLPSQFVWALADGAVLRATRYRDFELPPGEVNDLTREMVDLVQRDRDRIVAARVITDITVEKPVQAGRVQLRPVGAWGLNDAYADINRFIPGAHRLLDAGGRYRTGGSFTYATLRVDTEAPLTDRHVEALREARRQAFDQLETLLAALRLATASTSQAVVDIDAQPGHVRLWKPQVDRDDIELMENVQRIGRVRQEDAVPIAALGDRLDAWGGDDKNPHSLGVALSRYSRSFVTRPWFDMLVDIAVGLEAALLGGAEQDEISLRLRSRAAALLSTPADPEARIYEDVKRLYNLRSLVAHGSNPTTRELEAQAYKISETQRTDWKGVKWALALDRCRDLLRRAILARGFLLDAELWPGGRKARRFDVDVQLIDPGSRDKWRRAWRAGLEGIGVISAAEPAPPASEWVELPDHSRGPIGEQLDEGSESVT